LMIEIGLMNRHEPCEVPEFDKAKVDDVTLALLYLVVCENHDGITRAWKSFDWETMNRLHEQGMIDDPVSKAKSVIMTPEGFKKSKELFYSLFGTNINKEKVMQKYVDQLCETLREACDNRPGPRYIELSEEDECLRDIIDMEMSMEEEGQTMESIFKVPQASFPPENRLSDEQIRQLIRGILELWRAFHYEADFRKGEFSEREQYTKLVSKWKNTYPLLRGTEGAWHIEMYDYMLNWNEEEGRYVPDEED